VQHFFNYFRVTRSKVQIHTSNLLLSQPQCTGLRFFIGRGPEWHWALYCPAPISDTIYSPAWTNNVEDGVVACWQQTCGFVLHDNVQYVRDRKSISYILLTEPRPPSVKRCFVLFEKNYRYLLISWLLLLCRKWCTHHREYNGECNYQLGVSAYRVHVCLALCIPYALTLRRTSYVPRTLARKNG
jgi:hypothetical protein